MAKSPEEKQAAKAGRVKAREDKLAALSPEKRARKEAKIAERKAARAAAASG